MKSQQEGIASGVYDDDIDVNDDDGKDNAEDVDRHDQRTGEIPQQMLDDNCVFVFRVILLSESASAMEKPTHQFKSNRDEKEQGEMRQRIRRDGSSKSAQTEHTPHTKRSATNDKKGNFIYRFFQLLHSQQIGSLFSISFSPLDVAVVDFSKKGNKKINRKRKRAREKKKMQVQTHLKHLTC